MPRVASDLVVAELGAAGDRWNDADQITVLDGGVVFIEITDVFIVEIHIDEAAQLTVVAKEMILEVGVLVDEALEQLADSTAGDIDLGLLVGIRT